MVGRFPSRMFRWAAIYGIVALAPLYALPLPDRQPEVLLGFIGVALVFQWVFWIMSRDPVAYRALMLPAAAEKLAFGLPAVALALLGRTAPPVAVFGAIDLALAVGFWRAWMLTPAAG